MAKVGEHAVLLGASMGGLLAAGGFLSSRNGGRPDDRGVGADRADADHAGRARALDGSAVRGSRARHGGHRVADEPPGFA